LRCREILAGGEDWQGLAGLVAQAEGVFASAQHDLAMGAGHFARAIEIFRRYVLPFEEAETFRYWAFAANHAGAPYWAEKFDQSSEIYGRIGAGAPWTERINADRRELGRTLDRGTRHENDSTCDKSTKVVPVPIDTFRKEGDYWTISWAGHESRLKHRKGFDYVAQLLLHPGQEIAAADLIFGVELGGSAAVPFPVTASDAYQTNATITRGLGDAGAVLDATAKAQYRRRLQDLRDELETAEQNNDIGRTELARSEMQFIQAEISSAVRRGGRDRKSVSHAERARLAVTKAIKAALTRIRAADPELGRHLASTIQTGYSCAYRPRQPVTWDI
jgi:hypothetical protein